MAKKTINLKLHIESIMMVLDMALITENQLLVFL